MDISTLRGIAVALRRSLAEVSIPVDAVILFGSHARGEAGADSDIDLAVLSRSFGKNRFREGSLVNLYAHRIHGSLEVVPIALGEWFGRESVSPLVHEIRKEGVILI